MNWSVAPKLQTERLTLRHHVATNFPETELGWFVMPENQGKGLAFEAAATARDWALGPRGLQGLVSYISPGNHRSIALAERLGGVYDPDAARPEGDADDLVYRHRRAL